MTLELSAKSNSFLYHSGRISRCAPVKDKNFNSRQARVFPMFSVLVDTTQELKGVWHESCLSIPSVVVFSEVSPEPFIPPSNLSVSSL